MISTVPDEPCAYTLIAELLRGSQHPPVNISLNATERWSIIEFNAALAGPVGMSLHRANDNSTQGHDCQDVQLYTAAAGQTTRSWIGSQLDHAGSRLDLGTTTGNPSQVYVLALQYPDTALQNYSCELGFTAEELPVTNLKVDGKPYKFSLSTSQSSSFFRIPFSASAPFSKLTTAGVSGSCHVDDMFFGDSFFAGSQSPVHLSASQPGLFSSNGSPTMFVADIAQDAQQEDYLLSIALISFSN